MRISPAYDSTIAARIDKLSGDRFVERLFERDPSLWSAAPVVQESIRNRLGWLTVAGDKLPRADELAAFAREVREAGFRDVVLLGMGGSSLAPEVLAASLGVAGGFPALTVLDTTDPARILAVDGAIDPAHTLFIVASKSGTTIEVRSLFAHFWQRVQAAGVEPPGDSFIAITDSGTPLERLAEERGFRRTFVNPSDIGGRYSALSYFGLVPAALIGADVTELLRRGTAMAEACGPSMSPAENPGVRLGAALGELALAGRDRLTLVASPGVAAMGSWIEQLVAESTGKQGKGILPVDLEPLGSAEVYGDDRVFVRLALAGDGGPAVLAALREEGHPVITLDLADPYDLGGEFFRWEMATATAGAVLGINPFDEPNVTESKENTSRLLERYEVDGALPEGEPDLTEDGVSLFGEGGDGLAAALEAFLSRARPGDYVPLLAYLTPVAETNTALQSIRLALRDATRAATTVGFGPRYLHSTGQLHKGGPDNGLFILITGDDPRDLDVPGEPYTFGLLKRAQALGDLQALRSRGRRVIRLHVSGDALAGLVTVEKAVRAAVGAPARR